MIALVGTCAFFSLLFYVLFGGADFGAGVLEMIDRKHKEHVSIALAPVWEANHVWLILLIVIAFVAFPSIYVSAATSLHIPLLIALIGIMVRGCAFTFRHYDRLDAEDITEKRTHAVYDWAFRGSSVVVPLFLGISFASLSAGKMRATAPTNFYDFFVAPWLHFYGLFTGLFLVALFTFVASVLLAAEKPTERNTSLSLCRKLHVVAVGLGALVFLVAELEGVPLARNFIASPLSIGAVLVATTLIPAIGWAYQSARIQSLRVSVGAQVACVLVGFLGAQTSAVSFADAPPLTLANSAAPAATLNALGIALAIGLVLILPALGALFWTFKRPNESS